MIPPVNSQREMQPKAMNVIALSLAPVIIAARTWL
jgi:hypothetical protein